MTKVYNIDYDKLVAYLLPTFLRKRKLFDYLAALIGPIKFLHNDFKKFRADAIYKVTHNSQVFSMENVFNDSFDADQRRIFIRDAFDETLNTNYIYPNEDNKPTYLPIQFNTNSPSNDIDFEIVLPNELKPSGEALTLMINEINKLADYYKLASKTYSILWIN